MHICFVKFNADTHFLIDYSRKREFINPSVPDYSDGGVYEDDFGPEDPYTNHPQQPTGAATPHSPQITKQEEMFPGGKLPATLNAILTS